jgi:hypothetical protein
LKSTALGFDTGCADGRVGNDTMKAVQIAAGRRLCRGGASGAVATRVDADLAIQHRKKFNASPGSLPGQRVLG